MFLLVGPPGVGDDRLRTTWSSLRGRDPVDLERELRACYRGLFESPPPRRVELVESRFRGTARPRAAPRPAREAAARVRALQSRYTGAGFRPACASLAPDHLTVELHFLGHLLELASGEGPAARRAAAAARTFLEAHVLSWLPALRAEVSARREGSFYAAVLATAEANARALQRDLPEARNPHAKRATARSATA
jgi:TorA maturation chaperone TorD